MYQLEEEQTEVFKIYFSCLQLKQIIFCAPFTLDSHPLKAFFFL